MTLLVLFISLLIGLNLRYAIIPGIIETILILLFTWKRFSKKHVIVTLGVLLIGLGLSFIRPNFQKSEYKCLVIEVKENYFIASSSFEKLYIYEKNNSREIGDILTIKGDKKELSFQTIESQFDFKDYLNKKGVYSEIVNPKINVVFSNPIKIQQFMKRFLSQFDDNTSGLIGSLLFGSTKTGETASLFSELHLIRLISNSGIFLYLFYKLISFLVGYLCKEKYAILISNILFTIYGIFTFPRFVVIKFVTLLHLKWINKYLLKDKFSYLNLLCGSGIVFMLIDFNLARQDTFLFAYLIPIVCLFVNGSFRKLKGIKKKLLLTGVISLFFLPFTIKYYNEISPLSVPFQLLLTPLMMIYSLFGIVGLVGIPIGKPLNGFTNFIGNICKGLKPIFLKIYIPPFDPSIVLLYELMLLFIIYIFSISLKELYKVSVVVFTSFICINCVPFKHLSNINIYFINVGQGDACLISYKTSTVLIDTGGNIYKDIAKDCLIPFFKKLQIYKIDALITTHNDFDHNGAANSLMANFNVDNYFTSYTSFPLKIGDLYIKNLNTYSSIWNEDNDRSLVLYFNINNTKFLIMGDAPKNIENKIVEEYKSLDCDILKVGHHGSSTSTSEPFLNLINAKEAVISVGKNSYGHPEQSVIGLLLKHHIKIRRTDLEGTICYSL